MPGFPGHPAGLVRLSAGLFAQETAGRALRASVALYAIHWHFGRAGYRWRRNLQHQALIARPCVRLYGGERPRFSSARWERSFPDCYLFLFAIKRFGAGHSRRRFFARAMPRVCAAWRVRPSGPDGWAGFGLRRIDRPQQANGGGCKGKEKGMVGLRTRTGIS